jgi:hypothetical protein
LIINLKNLKKYNQIQSKICIIGAGTVGLFLANQLRLNKIPVTILEAGEEHIKNNINSSFSYEFTNSIYGNDILKKKNLLGGASTLWGGQMLPLQKSDIINRNYINLKSWVIKYKEIEKFFPIITKFFQFEFLKEKLKKNNELIYKKKKFFLGNKIFDLRFSTFMSPKLINFYRLFEKNIREDSEQKTYINAKVLKIDNVKNKNSKKNFSIKNIIAKSSNGNILEVKTDIAVICCGTLESTRLLLIYNEDNNNFLKRQGSPLGNYFSDLLSIKCGELKIKDWDQFVSHFSPIIKKRLIHSKRFELKAKLQKKYKIGSAYCNFIFIHDKKYFLKNLKKLLQRKKIVQLITFVLKFSPLIIKDMCNFLIYRIFKKFVWFTRSSKILFLVNVEQIPNFNNKIYIKKKNFNKKDKKLTIDWKIRTKDITTIKTNLRLFHTAWINSRLNKIADLKITLLDTKLIKLKIKEGYHPIGTIRIGSNKKVSVLDKNLKVWGVNNLFVCSTAIFPSSGSSNTGFFLLALTARLAQHLREKI